MQNLSFNPIMKCYFEIQSKVSTDFFLNSDCPLHCKAEAVSSTVLMFTISGAIGENNVIISTCYSLVMLAKTSNIRPQL